jgi:hypothetical protein
LCSERNVFNARTKNVSDVEAISANVND